MLKGSFFLLKATNLLSARKLEFFPSQSFNRVGLVLLTAPHRQDDLTNVHTCYSTLRFSKSTTHPSLKPKNKTQLTSMYEMYNNSMIEY